MTGMNGRLNKEAAWPLAPSTLPPYAAKKGTLRTARSAQVLLSDRQVQGFNVLNLTPDIDTRRMLVRKRVGD